MTRRLYSRACALALSAVVLWSAASSALAATAPSPTPTTSGTAVATSRVITVSPATGNDLVAFTLTTSGPCPAGSTNAFATVLGPGLPPDGINVVPNSALSVFPHTVAGGVAMSSSNTLRTLVSQLADPQPLKGTYRLRVECRKGALVADLGNFTGSIVFDGHHNYVATEPDVPASSLATVAAPSGPPIPTAVGSEAPQTSGQPSPAKTSSQAAAAASTGGGGGGSSFGPWLIVVGIVVVLAGVGTLVKSRFASGKASEA